MKKMTLLFTILCAGQLYGMKDLPSDVQHEIVKKAIESSRTIEDAARAINVACTVQGACYNNLKDFNKLLGLLQGKFPAEYKYEMAKKINTETARKYMSLNEKWFSIMNSDKPSMGLVKRLLDEGADPNFSWQRSSGQSLLDIFEVRELDGIVKLLKQYGGNYSLTKK